MTYLLKLNRLAICTLLVITFASKSRAVPQTPQEQTASPNMDETITFIRDHIVPVMDISAHQKTIQDSEGYFGGGWGKEEGFTIDTLSYDGKSKSIVFTGKEWEYVEGSDDAGNGKLPRPEKQDYTLSVPLPTVNIDAITLEHNPHYDDYKQQAQLRDRDYPFSYFSSPEWWITFSLGENNYVGLVEIGLPVESQATGQRVQQALLHAIELAGGRKAEIF